MIQTATHQPHGLSFNRKRVRAALRSGTTLAEVLVSTLIVGVLLVPTLQMMGSVARNYASSAEDGRARLLAESLLAEITKTDFYDEDEVLRDFGLEFGESNSNRSDFDDVDDYHELDEQPPLDRSGDPIPGCGDFRREVIVEHVKPSDPADTGGDTRLLRVEVTVSHPRRPDVIAETFIARFDLDRKVEKTNLKNVTIQMQFNGQAGITSGTAKLQNGFAQP